MKIVLACSILTVMVIAVLSQHNDACVHSKDCPNCTHVAFVPFCDGGSCHCHSGHTCSGDVDCAQYHHHCSSHGTPVCLSHGHNSHCHCTGHHGK